MLTARHHKAFKKDYKKVKAQGKDMAELKKVLTMLLNEEELPASLRDHALSGNWASFRELHLESDWLLIYKIADGICHLVRTGSHTELFD